MNHRESIEAIKNAEMAPSEKRQALKKLGVDTEYMPHQGKLEMARRRNQQIRKEHAARELYESSKLPKELLFAKSKTNVVKS